MIDQQIPFEEINPGLSVRILQALKHHESEVGPLEMVEGAAKRRGNRLYIPVRPLNRPPTLFSFLHAIAGAEVELRDEGLDVQLTPAYRQSYVVVASREGSSYIYLSEGGAEYDDLSRLLGNDSGLNPEEITLESYPFDSASDQKGAWEEAIQEHPEAIALG